jgi:hypothetical protein
MTTLFWASERTTEPPLVTILPTERRKIAVGLAGALNQGEDIVNGTVEAEVVRWRDSIPVDPTPMVGSLSYDTITKTAAQEIDASLLPFGIACSLIISFDVSYGTGTERRSSYVVIVSRF